MSKVRKRENIIVSSLLIAIGVLCVCLFRRTVLVRRSILLVRSHSSESEVDIQHQSDSPGIHRQTGNVPRQTGIGLQHQNCRRSVPQEGRYRAFGSARFRHGMHLLFLSSFLVLIEFDYLCVVVQRSPKPRRKPKRMPPLFMCHHQALLLPFWRPSKPKWV